MCQGALPLAGRRTVDGIGAERAGEQPAQGRGNMLDVRGDGTRIVRAREQTQDHQPELVGIGRPRTRGLREVTRYLPVTSLDGGERALAPEDHRVTVDERDRRAVTEVDQEVAGSEV